MKLLVAIRTADGDDADLALPKARLLASALEADVELFTVISPLIYDSIGLYGELIEETERAMKARALTVLEGHAAAFRAAGIATTASVELDVRAHDAIARHADAVEADLVIVGCPQRHPLAGLLQYADWELVRLCPRPLLLVKSRTPWQKANVLAAVDPGHALDKPAELDRRILQQAARLATALGGELHAVHAIGASPLMMQPAVSPYADLVANLRIAARKEAEEDFESLLARTGIVAERHLTNDAAAEAIPRVALACGADIVVMGAISRSLLKRWLLGTTALKVLDHLHADVLIVKPAKPAVVAEALQA